VGSEMCIRDRVTTSDLLAWEQDQEEDSRLASLG